MISKELLSLVLGLKVIRFDVYKDDIDGEIYIWYEEYPDEDNDLMQINLDTLGRLCKEWCYNQSFAINEYTHAIEVIGLMEEVTNCKVFDINNDNIKGLFPIKRLIKATEFVAKEKGLI